MTMNRSALTAPRHFARDARGTVTLIFGLVAVLLFSFIGAAVDYGRWSDANGRTVDALDAALLTAGRTLQTSQNSDEALQAAKKSFLETAKTRLNVAQPKIEVAIVDDGAALEAEATGKIATPFLGLINFGTLRVHAKSKVAFSASTGSSKGGSDLEISLMLDVTGSMCANGEGPCNSSPKLDALKTAASDLVNIILKNSGNNQSARIALVPFSTRVRLGKERRPQTEDLMKKLTNLDPTWSGWYRMCVSSSGGGASEGGGNWTCNQYQNQHVNDWHVMPCVVDRSGPQDMTDAAPGPNAWLIGHGGSRFPLSNDSADAPYTWGGLGVTAATAASHWEYNDDGSCADIAEKNEIMPLTSKKSDLLGRINDLEAYGSTAGTLGTAWTWYMLSPNWSNIWTGQSTPGSYADTIPSGSNPPKLRKIAVLMTDGMYNTERGWKDQDPVSMATKAKQVCTNMKAAGVEVYTVGFDLDSLSVSDRARAVDTLQNCGTDLNHFYEALNADQLKQSFRDIAMQLSQLFVAK